MKMSRSLNNSNKKKEQQRQVTAKTKREHFLVSYRTRYSTFVVTLITFIATLFIYNFIALNILFSSSALSHGCKESEK